MVIIILSGKNSAAYKISFLGLLIAVSVVLGAVENMIPPIPSLPPGIKPGLANIVVMFTLVCLPKRYTAVIVAAKSLFAFLTRGAVAGLMSLAGGAVSAAVMVMLVLIFKKRISILLLSVCGAVFHNAAQIFAAVFIIGTASVVYYLPVLVIAGVIMGYVTGMILRITLPAVVKISPYGGL